MRTIRVMPGLLFIVLLALLLARAASTPVVASGPLPDTSRDSMAGVDCSRIQELGIDKQINVRAQLILQHCGLISATFETTPRQATALAPSLRATLGGADVQVNNALADTFPHVTQAQGSIAGDGGRLVVAFESSTMAPSNYSGESYSLNGGTTFTEDRPSPFAIVSGTNYGGPLVLYNSFYAQWLSVSIVSTCGAQGLGSWKSSTPGLWGPGSCIHTGSQDDTPQGWVDNNPSSPYYGRIYIAWNNFAIGGGALQVTTSDDGGSGWSVPTTVSLAFLRNVQMTGAADGTVFLVAMDEHGGGTSSRQNTMYRSMNGGVGWYSFSMGASFSAPGDTVCNTSYFRAVSPIWREMGWGQAGVGPGGVVHYVYTAGAAGDSGDIMYTRSADNGATWSTPIRLNTDEGTRAQWQPSLAVTANGKMVATWYDRRNTSNNDYQRFERISFDNGLSWQPDGPLSDVVIPQPQQPDPNTQACFAGARTYSLATGDTVFTTWTDGRVSISSTPQEDVYLDRINLSTAAPACTASILLIYAETDAWPTTLQEAIIRAPGVGKVDLFDAHAGTPTLSLLQGYDAVFVYSNNAFADNAGLGNVLADFQDRGGVVITGMDTFYPDPSLRIGGRWASGGYAPFTVATMLNVSTVNLGIYDSTSPLMAGVTALQSWAYLNVTVASGATQVATWTGGAPLLAVKGGSVGINALVTEGSGSWKGHYARLIANATKTLHSGSLVSCKVRLPLLER